MKLAISAIEKAFSCTASWWMRKKRTKHLPESNWLPLICHTSADAGILNLWALCGRRNCNCSSTKRVHVTYQYQLQNPEGTGNHSCTSWWGWKIEQSIHCHETTVWLDGCNRYSSPLMCNYCLMWPSIRNTMAIFLSSILWDFQHLPMGFLFKGKKLVILKESCNQKLLQISSSETKKLSQPVEGLSNYLWSGYTP